MKRERIGRIDAAIQRALATTISRDMTDPRLSFTTVTRVEITPDLERAKVYVSIIGDRHQAFLTMEALHKAAGFLRGELGKAVDLRHTPELVFIEDRSSEKAIAVNSTLSKIQAARESEQAAAVATDAHGSADELSEAAVHDAQEEGLPASAHEELA
jgi:ribosome-binding factor A